MRWCLRSKPISWLCSVAGRDRPLRRTVALRRYLQSSALEKHDDGVSRFISLTHQRPCRPLRAGSLDCGWSRAQHAYPCSRVLPGLSWPRSIGQHICQGAALLTHKSQPSPSATVRDADANVHKQLTMDYTALVASIQELKQNWIPAKAEQVQLIPLTRPLTWHLLLTFARPDSLQCVQSDKQTLCLRLRTLDQSTWLYLCWHPVSGRICTGPPPERGAAAEAFSFGNDFGLFPRNHQALLLLLRGSTHIPLGLSLCSRVSIDVAAVR